LEGTASELKGVWRSKMETKGSFHNTRGKRRLLGEGREKGESRAWQIEQNVNSLREKMQKTPSATRIETR